MKKYLFLLYLTIFVFSGCCKDDFVSGYCVIYYENIENFPDSKISVDVSGNKITNHHYTLEPSDSILLSIDYTGDFYYLEVPGLRKDSITNIVVNRYGCQDSQVSEYSFYFNTDKYTIKGGGQTPIPYSERENIIRIEL